MNVKIQPWLDSGKYHLVELALWNTIHNVLLFNYINISLLFRLCSKCYGKRKEWIWREKSGKTKLRKGSKKKKTDENTMMGNVGDCLGGCEKHKNTAFLHRNTAHLVGCYSCAKKMYSTSPMCPLCKQNIERIIKIF